MKREPVKSVSRRLLVLFCLFSLLTLPSLQVATASTEGCPSAWKIDNTIKGGWAELNQAKTRLGTSMVLEYDEYSMIYSDYAGELGPMPKPSVNLLGVPDLYIYGNTKVAFKITVQVKDCPGKTEFVLQGGSLREFLGIKANPAFVQTTAKDFATNKGDSFEDFIKAQEFPACVDSLSKSIMAAGSRGGQAYRYISSGLISRGLPFCGLYTGGRGGAKSVNPILLNLTPGCALIDAESNRIPQRLGILVAPNKSCEFAFAFSSNLNHRTEAFLGAVINSVEVQNPIYVLESFKVSGPVTKKMTITCVKGKVSKKITGINPECPKGYKNK